MRKEELDGHRKSFDCRFVVHGVEFVLYASRARATPSRLSRPACRLFVEFAPPPPRLLDCVARDCMGLQPAAFRFEDPMFEKGYGLFETYANSKLALMMFAEELQHRLNREKATVIVNSVNPGETAGAWRRLHTASASVYPPWACLVYRSSRVTPPV